MATQTRYTRQTTIQAPPANPSAGADSNELSRELERFSSQRRAVIADQVQEESFAAGQSAGQDGLPPEANPFTVAGKAFNRGAMVAHQAAVQTDIRDSVGKYAVESPEDPAAFDAKVAGLTQGLLKEADPRMQPFIRERIADYAGRAKLGIISAQQERLRKDSIQDLQKGAQGMFDDATTAAFEGNVPMVEARRQELGNLVTEGVKANFLSPAEGQELHRKFEHEVVQQEVVGNFDRLIRQQGLDAGAKAIERWQATKPSAAGITSDEHEQVTRQLITLHNRQEAMLADQTRKRNALLAAEHVERQSRVQDAIKVLQGGFAPDPDQAKTIAADISWLQRTGDPADQARGHELARDFDAAQRNQAQVHQFSRLPTVARGQVLNDLEAGLRKGGASADQVQLLSSLRTTNAAVERELKNDPRGYAQRQGFIEDAPLDFSSAENLASSIAGRSAQSNVGKQLTGQPLPRLTDAEAQQLAEVYKGGQVDDKLAILGTITAGAGEDAQATLGQLDAKGNKRMALMGSMVMHGQGTVARDVMRGELVLAGDKAIAPKQKDYLPDVDNTIGAALSDWPEQRGQYIEAAKAKYAELKARAGDMSDEYNPRFMRESLAAVLPTAQFNDRRVAVIPGVTEDAFDDWVDTWTPDQFKNVAGADPAELLKLVKDRGRLIEVGFGQYGVALDSAASGREKVLVTTDGKPLRLTYPQGTAQ